MTYTTIIIKERTCGMTGKLQTIAIAIFFLLTPSSLWAVGLGISSSIGIADSPSQATSSQISDMQLSGAVAISDLHTNWPDSNWSLITSLGEQTVSTKDRMEDLVYVRTLRSNLIGIGVGYAIAKKWHTLRVNLIAGKSTTRLRLNYSSDTESSVGSLERIPGKFTYLTSVYNFALNSKVSIDVGAKFGSHHIRVGDKALALTGQQIDGKTLQLTQSSHSSGSKWLPKTIRLDSIQASIGITVSL